MMKIPSEVSISTISATAKIGEHINIFEINQRLPLSENDVVLIEYCNVIRTLDDKYIKKKKRNSKKRNFFNQVTLLVNANENRFINTKLFLNGSVQMTGCKIISDCYDMLNKLIDKLKSSNLVDDTNNLMISNFKVNMINSNFKIGYQIHREILYKLVKKKFPATVYKPISHSCVNIKYPIKNQDTEKISIFVFESGQIIITGAKNENHICEAYEFITNYLSTYSSQIRKKQYTLDDILDLNKCQISFPLKDKNAMSNVPTTL